MWRRCRVAERLGFGLHEGLLQSTSLWQWLCWRVAFAEYHANLQNCAEAAWEGHLHLHAASSKRHAFGTRRWTQVICPICPDHRRGAMRVVAELPGVQVLATYTLTYHHCQLVGPQKLADDRPHVSFQMSGESWRSAYPWTTLTWRMREFCLAWQQYTARTRFAETGLHFQSSEIDRLFDKLNNMLGNAGDDVKARLEKCIECCKQAWMDDTASERKSLIDLLCGIPEDDDRVQENRFHKWWHWTIFSQHHWRCYFVTETMITLV